MNEWILVFVLFNGQPGADGVFHTYESCTRMMEATPRSICVHRMDPRVIVRYVPSKQKAKEQK